MEEQNNSNPTTTSSMLPLEIKVKIFGMLSVGSRECHLTSDVKKKYYPAIKPIRLSSLSKIYNHFLISYSGRKVVLTLRFCIMFK